MQLLQFLGRYFAAAAFFFCMLSPGAMAQRRADNRTALTRLAVYVDSSENRELSFTDKKAAYYYTTTHSEKNDMWFAGWNIAGTRVLSDYTLYINNQPLLRKSSAVKVFPHILERKHKNAVETFSMTDDLEVLSVQLEKIEGTETGIEITGGLAEFSKVSPHGIVLIPKEAPDTRILVCPFKKTAFQVRNAILFTSASAKGFLIAHGTDEQDALQKVHLFRKNHKRYAAEREKRMEQLARELEVRSDDDTLNSAIAWIGLTLDQLITKQQGAGIYAGLPWFNQYWGRDMFISFPGACLVTGKYATARDILFSFARFQNTDTNSVEYGRIPNRAQPTDIIYNTADGTPRFAIQIAEYVRYSGDTSVIRALYPAIRRSIDGSLRFWVDESGFLTHADADTWMDAKKDGKTPFSPRGNRANDIQSLWYQQLRASAYFADFLGDSANGKKWSALAEKVKANFNTYFFSAAIDRMADRLTLSGEQDFQMRPNQLYAFELLDNEMRKAKLAKAVWESLVYPWGVASLSQDDPAFHPYHENWHYYHKDEAYHNGTVWLWNNGMAMQRLIEAGQQDIAFELFKNMNRQALKEGAVGSLAENADALPRPGAARANRSGTFLQAWSNAEHLRVWYQWFLGIRPDMIKNEVVVNPHIPGGLRHLQTRVNAGTGRLSFSYRRDPANKEYRYTSDNFSGTLHVSLDCFDSFKLPISPGQSLLLSIQGKRLEVTVVYGGKHIKHFTVNENPQTFSRNQEFNRLFAGTTFVKPNLRPDLKCLQKYLEKPLEY